MTANQIITALTNAEVNAKYDAQTARMMRDERFALTAAVKGGDAKKIAAAMAEAKRVAEMWSVTIR